MQSPKLFIQARYVFARNIVAFSCIITPLFTHSSLYRLYIRTIATAATRGLLLSDTIT